MNNQLTRVLALGVATAIATIITGCAADKSYDHRHETNHGVRMSGAVSQCPAEPPEIISQPEDQLSEAGENVTFVLITPSPGQYNYQWFRNDSALENGTSDFAGKIEGSDKSHLHLQKVNTNAAGFYYCRITDKRTQQATNSTEAALYVAQKSLIRNTISTVTGPLAPGTGTVPASDCSGPYYGSVKFPDPKTGAFWWKMGAGSNGTAADVTTPPVSSYDSKIVVMEDISGECRCAKTYGNTVAFKHCTGSTYCTGSKFKFTIYVTSPSNLTSLKGTPITLNVVWQ